MLSEEGAHVVVASFWGYLHPSDREVAAAVRRAGALWVDHRATTPEVRALASLAEMVVSTRLHGLVFAFAAGVPGVCLYAGQYYQDKSLGLAREWGQADWAVDIATEYKSLPARVASAWRNRSVMAQSLTSHSDGRLGQLDPVFDLFRTWAGVSSMPLRQPASS